MVFMNFRWIFDVFFSDLQGVARGLGQKPAGGRPLQALFKVLRSWPTHVRPVIEKVSAWYAIPFLAYISLVPRPRLIYIYRPYTIIPTYK